MFTRHVLRVNKSDAANNAKLLYGLTDIPDEQRTAQFHCTLVFAAPDKESLVVAADWPGRLAAFLGERAVLATIHCLSLLVPDKTAAEMSGERKNQR